MWTAIGLIIFGIGKIISPKYFRRYKTFELFEKVEEPSKLRLYSERIIGIVLLTAGIIMLIQEYIG